MPQRGIVAIGARCTRLASRSHGEKTVPNSIRRRTCGRFAVARCAQI
jgi:hypothetical protein